MKSATNPPLHITPKLRQDAQSVLKEGETPSSFAEEALRKQIENRKFQQEFITRGLAARDKAKATGNYVSKEEVMVSLRSILKSSIPAQSLEQLLDSVTPENIHDEIETGAAVCKEIW